MFMSLFDFALGKGLLQREPEFGQRLLTVTERYKTLGKESGEDESSKDEEPASAAGEQRSNSKSESSQRKQFRISWSRLSEKSSFYFRKGYKLFLSSQISIVLFQ